MLRLVSLFIVQAQQELYAAEERNTLLQRDLESAKGDQEAAEQRMKQVQQAQEQLQKTRSGLELQAKQAAKKSSELEEVRKLLQQATEHADAQQDNALELESGVRQLSVALKVSYSLDFSGNAVCKPMPSVYLARVWHGWFAACNAECFAC